MKRAILIFCAFCVGILVVTAQIRLSGCVCDKSTGKPLANVVVTVKENNKILHYTTTAVSGEFSFEVKEVQNRTLNFALLGYTSHSMSLKADVKHYNVELSPKSVEIKEVVVKAPPIKSKGDTIVYNVASFAGDADKTIGDVLKKMPGVEVEQSGKILYNGKSINKFYIEGLDMLEGRYGIATNNLPQRDVRSVEVLENHQPIKALSKTEYSEQAAINIKLKNDAKAKWISTLTAGIGATPILWNGELSSMRFKGKSQQMFTFKSNNTGKELSGIHKTLTIEDILSNSESYSLADYVSLSMPSAPDLSRNHTTFNRSHSFTANSLFSLGKDVQLTTQMIYCNERVTSDAQKRTCYFLADSAIVTDEIVASVYKQNELIGEFTLQANKDSYFLKNKLSSVVMWIDGSSQISGTYSNRQSMNNKEFKLDNNLQLVKNIGKNSVTLSSVNSYISKPQNLAVYNDGALLKQNISAHLFTSRNSFSFGRTISKVQLTLQGGIDGILKRLNSDLNGFTDTIGKRNSSNTLKYAHSYVSPKFQYKKQDWTITLNAPIHYYSTLKRPYCSPKLNISWEFSPQNELRAVGQLNYRPSSDTQYYNGVIMTDYRNFSAGDTLIEKESFRFVSLSMYHKNPLNMFFANGTIRYTQTGKAFNTQQQFIDDYIIWSRIPERTNNKSYSMFGNVSKGFDWSNLISTLKINYTVSSYHLQRNGVQIPYDNTLLSINLSTTAKPVSWCTIDYDMAYSKTWLNSDYSDSYTMKFKQMLKVMLNCFGKCRMSVKCEHFQNTLQENRVKNFLLLDGSISYSFSPSFEINCEMSNILDSRHYSYTIYNELNESFTAYKIRPCSVFISAYYKF